MLFHTQKKDITEKELDLKINDVPIEQVSDFDFLEITLNENLKWNSHINKISLKISKYTGVLNKLKHYLPDFILKTYMTV